MVHYNEPKCLHVPTNFIHGSHVVSQQISTPTTQTYVHVHFVTYTFDNTSHIFQINLWASDIPPKSPEMMFLWDQEKNSST